MSKKNISASLICADMSNPLADVAVLEQNGCDMLHIDILDGYFSPSMPLGFETVKRLREKTKMPFDAHVMAKDNSFFIQQLLDIRVERLCFQVETEPQLSRKLAWIHEHGVKAGVALAPGTPISTLQNVLEECDFVLLMMINPGYASDKSEAVPDSRKQKIADLREMIDKQGLHTDITIDGRTYLDAIPQYAALGATTFVAGTSSLFLNNDFTLKENLLTLRKTVENC